MSHFFAYMSRMRFIKRWSLMRNTQDENIQEHSLRVAMLAHALAVIRKRIFKGEADPERCALLGLFHDAHEVITGDLPTPVKYFNPTIREAYHDIEAAAEQKLLAMVPPELRDEYAPLISAQPDESKSWELVRAADKLCAYLKCVEETSAGNGEFKSALKATRAAVDAMKLPETEYFLGNFAPSFGLNLDEMG